MTWRPDRDLVLAGLIELSEREFASWDEARLEARKKGLQLVRDHTVRVVREAIDRAVERLDLDAVDLEPAMRIHTTNRFAVILEDEATTAAAELVGGLDRLVRLNLCTSIAHFLTLAVTADQLSKELGLQHLDSHELGETLARHWRKHQRLRDMKKRDPEGEPERLRACFELGTLGSVLPSTYITQLANQMDWVELSNSTDAKDALRQDCTTKVEAKANEVLPAIEAHVSRWVDSHHARTAAIVSAHLAAMRSGRSPEPPEAAEHWQGATS